MMRRSYITAMLAVFAGVKGILAQTAAASRPIVLYCDLSVTPAREQEMLNNFHNVFKPAAIWANVISNDRHRLENVTLWHRAVGKEQRSRG